MLTIRRSGHMMYGDKEVDLKVEDTAKSLASGKTNVGFKKKKKPAGGRNRRTTSADDDD
jgi:hypothetical protein